MANSDIIFRQSDTLSADTYRFLICGIKFSKTGDFSTKNLRIKTFNFDFHALNLDV